jgi:peptidoglycan/xylan/chitin deacetylase (PgdA/CDA1 family)
MAKKFLRIILLILAALTIAFLCWAPSQHAVPVLMYHNVAESYREPLNNVTPAHFSWQMKFLKKHGFAVISADELADGLHLGKNFPWNTVVITFDDGLDTAYVQAFPVLKRYGLPATFFIPSDRMGLPGKITWAQAQEMAASGFAFGSHMRHEEYLPSVEPAALWDEIAGSKKTIEEHLGRPVGLLAYPVGGYTRASKELVREAGYKAAFTTNRANSKWEMDLYAIRRIRAKDSDNWLTLTAKLSGYYNFFRSARNPN